MRRFGWIILAYTMPPDAEHISVLRVVIREDFNRSLAERLLSDLTKVLKELDALPPRTSKMDHVAAALSGGDGAAPKKKSAREIQEEIATYWRRP